MSRTTTIAIVAPALFLATTTAFAQQPIVRQVEADYLLSASASAGPWSSNCSHDEHVDEFPVSLRCGFSEMHFDEETGNDSAGTGEASVYANTFVEDNSLAFMILLEADGTSYGDAGGGGYAWINAGVLFELPYKADVTFSIDHFSTEFGSLDFEVFSQDDPNSPLELQVGGNAAVRLPAGLYVLRLEGEAYGDPSTDWSETFTEILVTPTWLDTPQMRADTNGDGMVDGQDLAKVLASFGSDNAVADLDRSGWVDGTDLAIILGSWGPVQTPEPTYDFDVDNDGHVTFNDWIMVLAHIQANVYNEDADINNDGVVNQADLDLIDAELNG